MALFSSRTSGNGQLQVFVAVAVVVLLASCQQASAYAPPRNPKDVSDALQLFDQSTASGQALQAQRALFWIQRNFLRVLRSPQLTKVRTECLMQILSQPMSVPEIEVFRAVRRIIEINANSTSSSARHSIPRSILLSTVRFFEIDALLMKREVAPSGLVPHDVMVQILIEQQTSRATIKEYKRQVPMGCPPDPNPTPKPTPRPQPTTPTLGPTTSSSDMITSTTPFVSSTTSREISTTSVTLTPSTDGTSTTASTTTTRSAPTTTRSEPTTPTTTLAPSPDPTTEPSTASPMTPTPPSTTKIPTPEPIVPPTNVNLLTPQFGARVLDGNFTLNDGCHRLNPLVTDTNNTDCWIDSPAGEYVTVQFPQPYFIRKIWIHSPTKSERLCTNVRLEISVDGGATFELRRKFNELYGIDIVGLAGGLRGQPITAIRYALGLDGYCQLANGTRVFSVRVNNLRAMYF